jgi:alpha-galactosidase
MSSATELSDILVPGTGMTATWQSRGADAGVGRIAWPAEAQRTTPALLAEWRFPAIDVAGLWHPGANRNRALPADWSGGFISSAAVNAPVVCLFGADGTNRLTFACSDALHSIELKAGIHEETAEFVCQVRAVEAGLLHQAGAVEIYLDTHPHAYHQALGAVSDWWAGLPGLTPSAVPEVARRPMYSTWYSFHQNVEAEGIERQCRLARELGCQAVIVDDGWQTADAGRGYAYCGDWQPSPRRYTDLAAHVARIHALGMKFLLWYSVPFVGRLSQAWERFEHKLLRYDARLQAGTLDPRYPDVREYLIDTYERALRDWKLDGFKLDFVDRFHNANAPPRTADMDYDGVPEAADRLLSDVIARLRAIQPDVMIEFRQSYIGPLMRKYGNLFRAGDCPADALTNRIRTIDLRLLAASTAVHADMLMWHPDEPVESAARQLLNVLFSVPQISVLLDQIPEAHQRMLRFWLEFWNEHRDVLLEGELTPLAPELLYPVVSATTKQKHVAAIYADAVVPLPADLPPLLLLVNATPRPRAVLETTQDLSAWHVEVFDAQGAPQSAYPLTPGPGLHALPIPSSGLARLRR